MAGGRPAWVTDFRSSLYLGMRHPARSLGAWTGLTTGVPAVLASTPGTAALEARIRDRLGTEAAVTSTSTLHALVDLRETHPHRVALLDEHAYPVAWLAAGRAAGRFRHHDPASLDRRLAVSTRRALVLADGWCTTCGRAAPLARYAAAAAMHDAMLVVDDSQALGVVGPGSGRARPLGTGGTGTVAAAGLTGDGVTVLVASTAKAYGVPMAFVAGPALVIDRLRTAGPTRTHSSQPSAADVAALHRALDIDEARGDRLRRGLADRIGVFVRAFDGAPVRARPSTFPFVVLDLPAGTDPHLVEEFLRQRRVRASVVRGHHRPHLAFLIRVDHTGSELVTAAALVRRAVEQQDARSPTRHRDPSTRHRSGPRERAADLASRGDRPCPPPEHPRRRGRARPGSPVRR